jgi:hypothetical protein
MVSRFDLNEEIEAQLAHQGVAAIRVEDGEVFILTVDMLDRLRAAADERGTDRVVVFVKTRSDA